MKIHESIYKSKTMDRFIKWAAPKNLPEKIITNYDKLQKIYPPVFMVLTIGIGQTGVILASDDMPKKRRIPLALNNIINCLISLTGGLIIAKHSKKLTDIFVKRAEVVFAKKGKEYQEQVANGIKTAIPMAITAFLFKYIGQVIATPITDKVNKFLIKKGLIDYSDKKEGLTKK
jgi:hypothetical protein